MPVRTLKYSLKTVIGFFTKSNHGSAKPSEITSLSISPGDRIVGTAPGVVLSFKVTNRDMRAPTFELSPKAAVELIKGLIQNVDQIEIQRDYELKRLAIQLQRMIG